MTAASPKPAATTNRQTAWVEAVRRRSKEIGPAAALAFIAYLAPAVGWTEGPLSPYTREIGGLFGCGRTAADNWLRRLQAAGLIRILDWDLKTGKVDLYVYDPTQSVRQVPVRADPQRALFEEPADDPPPEEDPLTLPMSVTEIAETVTHRHDNRPNRDATKPAAPPVPPNDQGTGDEQCKVRQAGAAFLAAGDDPKARCESKSDLRRYIRDCIGDRAMHASIDGRAADVVLEQGYPLALLEQIVERIRTLRETDELKEPGRNYFLSRMRKTCPENGCHWPEPRQGG